MNAITQPADAPETEAAKFIDHGLDRGVNPEIIAFACDGETLQTLALFFKERDRPSRVGANGIAGAADYLSNAPSPPLLLVDISDSPDPLIDIDVLAEVCEPGISVVAIGQANDIQLYRELIDSGVADYLVKPVSPEALDRAITKAIQNPAQGVDASQSSMIFVVGARGGIGSSTVAVNTAWQMAETRGKKTILVDLDLQFGTAALALDLEPGRGLREMLENPARIDHLFIASASTNASANLAVLGAEEPLDNIMGFAPEALDLLLAELRNNYEVVIVDIPRSLAIEMRDVMAGATDVMMVTDFSLAGMRDTMRLVMLYKNIAPNANRRVIVNRVGSDKKFELPKSEFEKGIDGKISLMIPDDVKAAKGALNIGKPIMSAAKGSKITSAIDQLCAKLDRGPDGEAAKPAKSKSLFGGLFGGGGGSSQPKPKGKAAKAEPAEA